MQSIYQELIMILDQEMGYIIFDETQDDIDISNYISDSINFINYIISIENKLNIELPDDFLDYDILSSAKGLAAKIQFFITNSVADANSECAVKQIKTCQYIPTNYLSDLSDSEWSIIEPLIPINKKSKWHKRSLVNAVMYFLKTNCRWRQLPHDFPPHSTVRSFFRLARDNGLWEKIMDKLAKKNDYIVN